MTNLILVNEVINLLARENVQAVSQDDWAQLIDDVINNKHDYILQMSAWRWASKFEQLLKTPVQNDFNFKYSYALPSDYLQRVGLYYCQLDSDGKLLIQDDVPRDQYSLLNNTININADEQIIALRYVSSTVNLAAAPGVVRDMIAYYIASIVAMPLLQNAQIAETYSAMYLEKLQRAQLWDQKEANDYERVR